MLEKLMDKLVIVCANVFDYCGLNALADKDQLISGEKSWWQADTLQSDQCDNRMKYISRPHSLLFHFNLNAFGFEHGWRLTIQDVGRQLQCSQLLTYGITVVSRIIAIICSHFKAGGLFKIFLCKFKPNSILFKNTEVCTSLNKRKKSKFYMKDVNIKESYFKIETKLINHYKTYLFKNKKMNSLIRSWCILFIQITPTQPR